MRIDAYNHIQQLYNTQKTAKTEKPVKKSFADQVEISGMGKDIQTAKAAVKAAPDIRMDVVGPIKQRIQNGSYSVDTESFAEKLYERMNGVF